VIIIEIGKCRRYIKIFQVRNIHFKKKQNLKNTYRFKKKRHRPTRSQYPNFKLFILRNKSKIYTFSSGLVLNYFVDSKKT